jgi:hypothetical protein
VSEQRPAEIERARINPCGGAPPPLILCESRSLSGVLRGLAARYLCPIGGTNGQAGGYLRTDVLPVLAEDGARRVLYLGDYDLSSGLIEQNTRRVLEQELGWPLDWTRLAITAEQIIERDLEPISKADARFNGMAPHEAWETEALGQTVVVELVRDALDELLPQPLDDVLKGEETERADVRAALERIGLP